jgi:hypothetical protein
MKKQFYNLVLGVVMLFGFTVFSYAQPNRFDESKQPKEAIDYTSKAFSKGHKNAWIGGGFTYYQFANTGDHIFIAGSEFSEIEVGNKITYVQFFHHFGTLDLQDGSSVTLNNTGYTIKIYENPILGGDSASVGLFDTTIGTPVYQESFSMQEAEGYGIVTAPLTTPYTVNSNDFWIAISYDNGRGAILYDATLAEDKYYMYYTDEDENKTYIINIPLPLSISLYLDNGKDDADVEAAFVDAYPSPTAYITTTSISQTADLSIYPVVINNGPNDVNKKITISVKVGNHDIYTGEKDFTSSVLEKDYISVVTNNSTYLTLTAAKMDELGLSGNFNIVFTTTYTGIEIDPSNNTATLAVTRGSVGVAEQDQIYAISLYPNPVSDYLKINNIIEATDINIYNVTGQLVKKVSAATGSVDIDVNNLSNGIYIVKMQSGKNTCTEKIQVVR